METLWGIVANTIILSSMYILVALGFGLLHNIMGILHIAHGAIYMISGYLCFTIITSLGIGPWISMVITVFAIAPLGLFLERFCFRPSFGSFEKSILIGTALILIIQTTVSIIVRQQTASIPAFVEGIIKIGPVSVNKERIFTAAMGVALMAAVLLFIKKSKPGLQMQAIAQDLEGALLQGIKVHRISQLASAIACALAAVAGCLMGAYLSLDPFMGEYVLGKALVLVVLGGMGSLGGIFYAGLVMGGLDAFFPVFFEGATAQALAMGIVVCILLFRPTGFFGRELH